MTDKTLSVLCQQISASHLSPNEMKYLSNFLGRTLELKEIWALMDEEWDRCGAGYGPGFNDAFAAFYSSPVWLLNGIFTECDPESMGHRDAMVEWIGCLKPQLVAEYGGGYGSLGRKLASRLPSSEVRMVEPYPSKHALHLASRFCNLTYTPSLPRNCDAVVAQDVLEHIPDPLRLFGDLLAATRLGGTVITANCFLPVVKCHLPESFHFRYSFGRIVSKLGCVYESTMPNVGHAQIFRKIHEYPDWRMARRLERVSRAVFPFIELVKPVLGPLFRGLKPTTGKQTPVEESH